MAEQVGSSPEIDAGVEFSLGSAVQPDGTIILPVTKIYVNVKSRKGVTDLTGGINVDLLETGNVLMVMTGKGNAPENMSVITFESLEKIVADLVNIFKGSFQRAIEIENLKLTND